MESSGFAFIPVLFFGLFIIIALILYSVSKKAEEEKIARFMRFALANGLSFSPNLGSGLTGAVGFFERMAAQYSSSAGFLTKYRAFQPVGGHTTTAKYIFEGKFDDCEYEAFHFQYTTSNGKSSQTHYFMVASIQVPGWFSRVKIGEEGFFHGIGKVLGMQDIQLDSSHFNEKYLVQGDDEKAVFDLMHPQMMELFMHWNPPGFQLDGNRVVIWKHGILREDFVEYSLKFLKEFWVLVPEYVKQDRRGGRV
ncbi:MAG: hypothetical protein KF836_06730 [Fimbriimonadaceae bacterium]|nr:hypothetical protein [Fimbriimonadaceae bacterium]